MELLAPAGNAENFFTALEAGADAVYVGAPGFNARNLAKDIRLDEIAAMIRYCRSVNKKIYIAANSLLLEHDLPNVLETLGVLEQLQPDALIVQDLGIINLLRNYFPQLKYHASTLMGAHNLMAVDYYAGLGCERIVLARELTLEEIHHIGSKIDVELEVFVHGAMCFSYSGLCLFSSYLGGKSSMRGRCVQPCRRSYSQKKQGKQASPQKKGHYLFSMSDLEGLEVVRDLRDIGISSLKIEGRLRSANYVENVVRAYRLVIDAGDDEFDTAIEEAKVHLAAAMARKASSGYFLSPQPEHAISPYHSGNMGLHLGRAKRAGNFLKLKLKEPLVVGDRLRFHPEPSGERVAVTLKEMRVRGDEQNNAKNDETVTLPIPEKLTDSFEHVDIYKVDTAHRDGGTKGLPTAPFKAEIITLRKQLQRDQVDIRRRVWETAHAEELQGSTILKGTKQGKQRPGTKRSRGSKLPLEWWLRVDSVRTLQTKMELTPDRFLIEMDRYNVQQAGQLKKMLGKRMRSVIWALPTVISDRGIAKYQKQIRTLLRAGFRSFQIGHLSQVFFFGGERVFLSGDYSLNLINNQALLTVAEAGLENAQLSIEADKESLRQALLGYKQLHVPAASRGGGKRNMRLGLTVYGAPPLFTSRIDASFFQHEKPIVSPKQENFVISKGDGVTLTRPLRPFSLLPYLDELKRLGLDYVIIDTTGGRSTKKDFQEISDRLSGVARLPKLPTFNYLGKLE
ncbi:peptidase U32 family protein [Desulfopila sp. IMCC35008]|uniref:peptidase U32 family protein n=1 Tax=Desulfopila sp. IMCC35008 TaxID=2653858 RepID=UPI0013D23D38|nr:peptidase U32 family protein [Desulfopila sp. IMCC35008]